jgi:hypothetical protein
MKKGADFSRKTSRITKHARKKSDDLLKLHLTHSREKLIPKRVINIYLHDFAQQVRSDEGVILHGN